jgi:hypothetical protein
MPSHLWPGDCPQPPGFPPYHGLPRAFGDTLAQEGYFPHSSRTCSVEPLPCVPWQRTHMVAFRRLAEPLAGIVLPGCHAWGIGGLT